MSNSGATQADLRTTSIQVAGVRLGLAATAQGLRQIRWMRPGETWPRARAGDPLLRQTAAALRAYFAGQMSRLDPPLDLSGIPAFRRRVMEVLRSEVPPGEVVTYGELALLAGRPGAARAVGSTMSNNPLPIFVPCHRVVASNGPGGFGPGLAVKRQLLRIEGGDLEI